MKISIKRKLQIGFILVLLILIVQSVVSNYQITTINTSYSDLVDDKAKKVTMIESLENAAKDEQVNLQSFLFTGDGKSLQKYYYAVENYDNQSKDLSASLKLKKGKKLLSELNEIEGEYRKFANSAISVKRENQIGINIDFEHGKDIINRFSDKAIEYRHYQNALLEEGHKLTSAKVESIKWIVLILSIISVLLGLLISYFMGLSISNPLLILKAGAEKIALGDLTNSDIRVKNRDEIGDLADSFNQMAENLRGIIKQVRLNAEQVAATSEEFSASAEETKLASQQITGSIQEVASSVEKQFYSIEETSRTIREMAIGVHQIANNSHVVSDIAKETSEKATEGGKSINIAVEQMNSIHQTVQGLAEIIANLGARSQEINQIIEVISNISDQTNLLALNAAIEAARAGEHGRGFSVVADEVRKLAEQSASSAQQISKLINGIQGEANNAIQSMEGAKNEVFEGLGIINTAGELFSQIEVSVNNVAGQIQEVSSAVQQMAAGSEQLNQSMNHISEIGEVAASSTQEVSAAAQQQFVSMEEITTSALSLSKMAEELESIIAKVKI